MHSRAKKKAVQFDLSPEGILRSAVRCALATGAASSALFTANAYAQAADQPKTGEATELERIEVTGTHIRRVDLETSNLVDVIDRQQIEATGAATLEQLMDSIPAFSGTPFNSQNNNGPIGVGNGEAYVDLRGLAPKRTLVLLDGHRINNVDVNSLPTNMIDHVEILKEGAAATYGTDAIGGVVNFITRKNFTGAEALASTASTFKNDGKTTNLQLTMGSTSPTTQTLFGVGYNRQTPIWAKDRSSSSLPMGFVLSTPSANTWTSSRAPGGKFNGTGYAPPASTNVACPTRTNDFRLVRDFAIGSTGASNFSGVTRIAGTSGDLITDYRSFCSNVEAGYSDRYNYQPENLTVIPSQHYQAFGMGNLAINSAVSWFGKAYFNRTTAHAQLAAEPFDGATIAGIYVGSSPTISANNFYNPFGTSITVSSFAKRSTDVGDRIEAVVSDSAEMRTGFRGTMFSGWSWETGFAYGRYDQKNENKGFMDFSKVLDQLGPSSAVNGPCQTASGDSLLNCTSLNVFGTQGYNLSNLGVLSNFTIENDTTELTADVSGDVLQLPAGALGLAVGAEYRKINVHNVPDALAQQFELSENNGKVTGGTYNVKEAYAETLIPLVSDMPAIESLKATLGVRFSKYSSFGNNTSGKYALEYRPYSDLMLRGTYQDVYRAPNNTELFQGALQSAPAYSDPCAGLTTAQLATHPIACANVPAGFSQTNTQANGVIVGNPTLEPEKGHSTAFGLVFSPSFYKPVTISVDYWDYQLKRAIDTISLDEILNACFASETSTFCGTSPDGQPYFTRAPGGAVANSQLLYENSNQYKITGYDFGVKFNYPNTPFGRLTLGVDAAYLKKWQLTLIDPSSGSINDVASVAGQFDPSYTSGSYPRLRALSFASLQTGPVKVNLQDRLVSSITESQVDYADAVFLQSCNTVGINGPMAGSSYALTDLGSPFTDAPGVAFAGSATATSRVMCTHEIKPQNYIDVSASYDLEQLGTELAAGITDLFDNKSPQSYNGTLAGAANPTYDNRGRAMFVRVKVMFK